MIKTILVSLDGTKIAEAALPWALAIANRAGGHIRLASVLADGDADAVDERHPQEQYLAEARAFVAAHTAPDASVSSVLLEGPVAQALCEEARGEAELMITGSHGRGGFDRMWLGSVADALLRECAVPLIVVKPEAAAAEDFGASSIRRIVVPLDGVPSAEQAIQPALEVGRLFDAVVTLFRAVSPSGFVASRLLDTEERTEELLRQAKTEAVTYLETVRSEVDDGSCTIECAVGVHRSPARSILEYVAEDGADLVVLTTGKRYPLARGLLGSVADKVVRGAPVPVLVLKASS